VTRTDGGTSARRVWSGGAWLDVPVHAGGALAVDATVIGPVIIEEPTTTIVIPDGAIATVRPGHYLVEVTP
jgi:N-methylhydantoinase A/oxoprolinase/acetone carboxylase beta subunit